MPIVSLYGPPSLCHMPAAVGASAGADGDRYDPHLPAENASLLDKMAPCWFSDITAAAALPGSSLPFRAVLSKRLRSKIAMKPLRDT